MLTSALIRQDVVPMATGYVLVMVILGAGLRLSNRSGQVGRGVPASAACGRRLRAWLAGRRGERVPGREWFALIGYAVGLAAGGYLTLMVVVIAYYYLIARVGGSFIESAFTGNALLLGLAAPVFMALSWLAERRPRPHSSRQPTRQQPSPGEPASQPSPGEPARPRPPGTWSPTSRDHPDGRDQGGGAFGHSR
jgi:hypothetical protein